MIKDLNRGFSTHKTRTLKTLLFFRQFQGIYVTKMCKPCRTTIITTHSKSGKHQISFSVFTTIQKSAFPTESNIFGFHVLGLTRALILGLLPM